MFVAINNTDMNINDVEKWIKTARDANGGVISPESAMEVLSKTNHLGHIKKVLRNIKDNCVTPDKIAPYREFILSCVDSREMSGEALKMLQDMAKLCGCEDELETINKKPKFYGKFDCNNAIIVKSIKEFEALRGENLRVYFDADYVNLGCCDLSGVKELKFREGAEVNLSGAKNLPKDLDVSMCSRLWLHECDLEGLNLKFREGAEVILSSAENLPKDLDVSMCSRVDLERAKNLPKDLDISQCSVVDLSYCDLEGLNLKFKEGAVVNLYRAKNLPKNLDVSMCSKVELRLCDLEGLNLKFREGAVVNLVGAKNLPKDLDVSMCDEVNLRYCDLSKVSTITFKNKEQEEKFMKGAENFSGEVIYADEDKKEKEDNSLFSRIKKRFASGGMGE